MKPYPMKLIPACKDYIWGGNRLKTEFGKKSDKDTLAESWELSCHPDGESVIQNGFYAGRTLKSVLNECPEFASPFTGDNFPFLIKLIDAKDKLSLQVHPTDDYAQRVEHEYGKNEMWYILDSQPNAKLILGTKQSFSRQELFSLIEKNEILDVLQYVSVQPGDLFFIPAGMLHAIGEGILLVEVQQSSNSTYRVYDYERRDVNGNLRPLHIDKALDVLDTSLQVQKITDKKIEFNSFSSQILDLDKNNWLPNKTYFCTLLVLDGDIEIVWDSDQIGLTKGECVFFPTNSSDIELTGKAKVLVVSSKR